jgi:hypothetical protein
MAWGVNSQYTTEYNDAQKRGMGFQSVLRARRGGRAERMLRLRRFMTIGVALPQSFSIALHRSI